MTKTHVSNIVKFLLEREIDYATAVTVRKLVNLHGSFTLQVNGVVSYTVTTTPGVRGYDVHVENALV